ncbi:MAG: peptidoglycan-binding domain-containing protein, partial [Pyrinomonadaceae bacterium]
MAGIVKIDRSVGTNGTNLAPDVLKIGVALVEVGPDQGGIFAPPLSVGGLGEAIKSFQEFQKLRVHDGKVDPAGSTLRRINEILNPGWLPPVPRPPTGSGILRSMQAPPGAPTSIGSGFASPLLKSLITEMEFEFIPLSGTGRIVYFEIDDNVVPNWFGVVVPNGLTDFRHAHIFFHPLPSQAGYKDDLYGTKAGWGNLFHYMTDPLSQGFCAASTGQILIMPIMTQASSADGGILPRRWESIVGQILGFLSSGQISGSADPVPVGSIVVSSFSNGIAFSAAFRKNATGLSGKLNGVIDFDGIVSSQSHHSIALGPSGSFPVVKFYQMPATEHSIQALFGQNVFPLPKERWKKFYAYPTLSKNPKRALEQIHGWI